MYRSRIPDRTVDAPLRTEKPPVAPSAATSVREMGDEATSAEPVTSDYVRVKRKKSTIFLYVDQADTSHDLRAKVNAIMKVPTTDIKFYLDRDGELPLDEHKTLADMKVRSALTCSIYLRQLMPYLPIACAFPYLSPAEPLIYRMPSIHGRQLINLHASLTSTEAATPLTSCHDHILTASTSTTSNPHPLPPPPTTRPPTPPQPPITPHPPPAC